MSLDNKAVSPAVGIVLLIAIVIVLGAATAFVVTQLGPDHGPMPAANLQATVDYECTGGDDKGHSLYIEHISGEPVDVSGLTIRYRGLDEATGTPIDGWNGSVPLSTVTDQETIEPGDEITIENSEGTVSLANGTIILVWGDADRGTIMKRWDLSVIESIGRLGDHDAGHGNDCDFDDEDNPGQGGPNGGHGP